ncbi:MAG: hypothetical protein M1834_000115 [Cirrosporium novae-zelandiae]|nr:MAG: hypothetical protein M1834_000115 [Cirrosporium novae-zelandiae]
MPLRIPSPSPVRARPDFPKKKLIVCCDGTWLNSDNSFVKDTILPWDNNGHLEHSSNVSKFCRSVDELSADGTMSQITYYQSGIGSSSDLIDHIWGGTTGAGLSEHIREAYSFLADNWSPGDEIYLIGFSRGAFTARSIAAFIEAVGLLTPMGMLSFYPVFDDWVHQEMTNYKSPFPDLPFSDRPCVKDTTYMQTLSDLGLSRPNIPIKAIGVFDTVGALGIPSLGIFPQRVSKDYVFVNQKVPSNVEYAFQALALDEFRRPFSPSLWHVPEGEPGPKTLKQVWFPGVHTDVGGGYEDTGISDITLAWMMSQLEPFIKFHTRYLLWQNEMNEQHYGGRRPWSFGDLHNSMRGFYYFAGAQVRTPDNYRITSNKSRLPSRKPLQNTNESIHASVRIRTGLKGPGLEGKGEYNCRALKGWQPKRERSSGKQGGDGEIGQVHLAQNQIKWTSLSSKIPKEMPEDLLGEIELQLLMKSPDVWEKFTQIGIHEDSKLSLMDSF